MTTNLKTPTLDQQITQLESEINERQRDIGLLKDALEAILQNKPRPQQPSADSIHALLTEMIGEVPQNLEQQRLYSGKLQAAQSSLQVAIEACQQKQSQLKSLCQMRQQQQQTEAFERLKLEAERFNQLINQAITVMDEMRSLDKQAGGRKLEVTADLGEAPYCSVNASSVKVRRRFDVLRG